MTERQISPGWIAAPVAAEFPELRVASLEARCVDPQSDPGVAERLGLLASRFNGRQAIEMRQAAVTAAYRAFYRQIGINPEEQRTPAERAALDRLLSGGNQPQGRVADALLLALLETGVPVYCFDPALVDGPVGIDLTKSGTLVLADDVQELGELFSEADNRFHASPNQRDLLLVAVGAPGVPRITIDESLWLAESALTGN